MGVPKEILPFFKDDIEKLSRFTKLSTISSVCEQKNCRWLFVDNAYRGRGDERLGDMVVN